MRRLSKTEPSHHLRVKIPTRIHDPRKIGQSAVARHHIKPGRRFFLRRRAKFSTSTLRQAQIARYEAMLERLHIFSEIERKGDPP